uniref:uncharacterized protein LOC114674461 n=1 Tax=Macaca mulatta TaxID=9544 RepID=UPI0010A28117|nr:uncharacterized protein LOC114674461 [Macaca mulatta]
MTELSATRSPSPLGVLRGGHSPAAAPAHTGREQGRGAPAPQCVRSPAALSRRHQPGRLLLHVSEVSRLGLRFQPSVPPQRLTPPSPLFPQPGSGPAQHRWTLPKGCARHRCHRAVPRPAAVRTPETARQAGSRPPSADHPEPAGQRRGPGREREGLEGALDPPSQPGRRHLGLSQGRPRPPHSRVPVTRAAGPLLGKPGGPRGARGTSSARARRFPLKFHRSPRRSGSAHRGLRSARMGGRWAGWLHPAVGTNFENGPCAPLGCGADPGTAAAGGVGGERRRRAGRTRHLRPHTPTSQQSVAAGLAALEPRLLAAAREAERGHTASLLLFLMPGPLSSSPVSLPVSLSGSVCACSAFPCSPGQELHWSVHSSPGPAPAQRVRSLSTCLPGLHPSLCLLSDCLFSFPHHTVLQEVSLSAFYFIFTFFSVTYMFEFFCKYFCFIFAFFN